ncbi:MAG: serine hydrolase domain-containing protein [Bacteroidota bacterium]
MDYLKITLRAKYILLFLGVFLLSFQREAKAQSLYFPPNVGNQWDTISPGSLGWCQNRIDSLYQFLDSNNTKAFLLLKDGKIVLENYFGGFAQNDPWYWASAGKTVTSFMTGIAQQEGFLSINDTTSQYLGTGWTSCTQQQEEKITIWHQLTMTSGLDDGVPDHYCTLDTCLVYKADAGTRWAYHNGPYTLLDQVISTATGNTLNNYTSQKLLGPIGMSGAFLPNGYNNVFYSNARSMARFGLLILNRGVWNGNVVMSDTNYFNQMVNTSQQLNKSYGYLWWLNGKPSFMLPTLQNVFQGSLNPNAPADMIAALGKNGQVLNVVPSQNLVWLRMGDSQGTGDVSVFLNNQIWDKINQLPCPTSITEPQINNHGITCVFNSFTGDVSIKSEQSLKRLEAYDPSGKLIMTVSPGRNYHDFKLPEPYSGFVILRATSTNGFQAVFKGVVFENAE